MPDLLAVLNTALHNPELLASYAIWTVLLLGVVKFTPPAANCGCGGDMETCRCGTPRVPTPRPFSGGAR